MEDVTLESSASSISQAGKASSCSQHSVSPPVSVFEQVHNQQLMERIQLLEARIQELEKTSPVTLMQQADQLQHSSLILCCPDHFQSFSIDRVIEELKEQAPDMYKFFMQLCDVQKMSLMIVPLESKRSRVSPLSVQS